MSDTPRTDAERKENEPRMYTGELSVYDLWCRALGLSRQLESELAAMTAERDDLQKQLSKAGKLLKLSTVGSGEVEAHMKARDTLARKLAVAREALEFVTWYIDGDSVVGGHVRSVIARLDAKETVQHALDAIAARRPRRGWEGDAIE